MSVSAVIYKETQHTVRILLAGGNFPPIVQLGTQLSEVPRDLKVCPWFLVLSSPEMHYPQITVWSH